MYVVYHIFTVKGTFAGKKFDGSPTGRNICRGENFAVERGEGVPQAMLLTFGTPHFGKPHSCRPDQTGRVKDGAWDASFLLAGSSRQDQRQSMESLTPAGRIKPAGSKTEQRQAFYRFQPLYAFYLLHPRYPSMSRPALSELCLAPLGVVQRYPRTARCCPCAVPGSAGTGF